MTTEQFLERLWQLVEQFGPWLLGFAVLMVVLVLAFIIWVFIGLVRDRGEFERTRRRFR